MEALIWVQDTSASCLNTFRLENMHNRFLNKTANATNGKKNESYETFARSLWHVRADTVLSQEDTPTIKGHLEIQVTTRHCVCVCVVFRVYSQKELLFRVVVQIQAAVVQVEPWGR